MAKEIPSCLLLLLFCLISFESKSQLPSPVYHPAFRVYNSLDGKTQTLSQHIFQDSKGYIWEGAREGVNKFDGLVFENHNTNPEFPDDITTEFKEAPDGSVWVPGRKGIYRFYNDSVENVLPDSLCDCSPKALTFTPQGVMWVIFSRCSHGFLFQVTGKQWKAVDWQIPELGPTYKPTFLASDRNGIIWLTYFQLEPRKINALARLTNPATGPQFMDQFSDGIAEYVHLRQTADFHIYFSDRQKLYRLENGEIHVWLDLPVFPVWFSLDGTQPVLFSANEVFIRRDDTWENTGLYFNRIYDLLVDQHRQYWLATDQGLVKVPSLVIDCFPKSRGMDPNTWQINQTATRELLFASYENGLQLLDLENNRYHSVRKLPPYLQQSIPKFSTGSFQDSQGRIFLPTVFDVLQFTETKELRRVPGSNQLRNSAIQDIAEYEGQLFFAGLGVIQYDRDGKFSVFNDEDGFNLNLHRHYETIAVSDRGEAWLGSHTGLAKINLHTRKITNYSSRQIGPGINSSCKDHRGTIWLGTHQGLARISENRPPLQPILLPGISGSVKFIHQPDSSTLILGMLDRLVVLDLSSFYQRGTFSVKGVIDKDSGFAGVDCIQGSDFMDHEGNFWFSSRTMVQRINLGELKFTKTNPIPVLNEVDVLDNQGLMQNTLTRLENPFNLYSNSKFSIKYSALDLHRPAAVRYQYRLLGRDTAWSAPSPERSTYFSNLRPGNYTFQVRAGYGSSFAAPAELQFSIIAASLFHRYRLVTYILICLTSLAIIASAAVAYVYRKRLQAEKVAARNEQLRREVQLQLRLNQTNPHFIINSLNAIVSTLTFTSKELAARYLKKFSSLLRATIYEKQTLSVPLYREVEFLQNYLELERLRFSDRMELHIYVDPDISQRIMVPRMIIQSIANNAIKHGLEPLINRKGELHIHITQGKEYLNIHIRDNGKGRKDRNQLHGDKNAGIGMKIVQTSLDLFNARSQKPSFYRIIDLPNSTYAHPGTLVELYIYKHYGNR